YNIFNGKEKGLELFDTISQNTSSYNKEEVEQKYKSFKIIEGGFTIKTFYYHASIDNINGLFDIYKIYKSMCSLSTTDVGMAKLFHKIYKKDLFCSYMGDSSNVWYHYDKSSSLWRKETSSKYILGLIKNLINI